MFSNIRKTTSSDVDSWARDLSTRITNDRIPPETTMAIAARLVEVLSEMVEIKRGLRDRQAVIDHGKPENARLMARVAELEREKHLRAVGVDPDNVEDQTRWADAQHYFFGVHVESNRNRRRVVELESKLRHELEHFRRRNDTWADVRSDLQLRVTVLEAKVNAVGEWTHKHGKHLVPNGPDTYGDGVRACKQQVANLLRHAKLDPTKGQKMDKSKQKWWVRWYTPGEDSRPATVPTPIEWWCTGSSDTHSINCGIVHGIDEADCLRAIQTNGWPECPALDFCEGVEQDWRPPADRFPPSADQDEKAKT